MTRQLLPDTRCTYGCEHVGNALPFEGVEEGLGAVPIGPSSRNPGLPLHLVEDIAYLGDGRPGMLTENCFRGARPELTFKVRLGRLLWAPQAREELT